MRMLRAVAMAARLGFTIDPPIDEAIAAHRGEIARSAPARLIEEFYKLLRSGASEQAFRMLAERRLLEPIAHELQKGAGDALWQSLAALDAYRKRFEDVPDTLTNAVLLGSLLVPLGIDCGHPRQPRRHRGHRRRSRGSRSGCCRWRGATSSGCGRSSACSAGCSITKLSPRARRALMHRGPFREALDLARDPRPGARGARALARVHRSLGRRRASAAGRRTDERRRAGDAAAGVARRSFRPAD